MPNVKNTELRSRMSEVLEIIIYNNQVGCGWAMIDVTAILNVSYIMCCGACCKEFLGWCRAFTRNERVLTIVEAILLVLFVGFLIFLILHLLACSTPKPVIEVYSTIHDADQKTTENTDTPKFTTTSRKTKMTKSTNVAGTNKISIKHRTIDPNKECSWTPSAKTAAGTRYFEQGATQTYATKSNRNVESFESDLLANNLVHHKGELPAEATTEHGGGAPATTGYNVEFIEQDQSDGEEADAAQNEFILALVKPKPPAGVVFGCMLTLISELSMLTSASCIEAIEEVDSLDSFVIMEDYGTSAAGRTRPVADVRVHPFYGGLNRSFDLALVRSAQRLPRRPAALAAPLDLALAALGERYHVLGFGPYRSAPGSGGRRLRAASVFLLAGGQCAGAALRHLEAGGAAGGAGGAGGAAALCAGALFARGLPCQYCGGAPLLRGARVLALMADNPQCGAACEPQRYVPLAPARAWLDALTTSE